MMAETEMEREALSPGDGAFVIQFRASADVEQGRFSGRVEHVASGEVGHFRTPEELADLVKRVLARRDGNKPSKGL